MISAHRPRRRRQGAIKDARFSLREKKNVFDIIFFCTRVNTVCTGSGRWVKFSTTEGERGDVNEEGGGDRGGGGGGRGGGGGLGQRCVL